MSPQKSWSVFSRMFQALMLDTAEDSNSSGGISEFLPNSKSEGKKFYMLFIVAFIKY